ncbi:MAG: sigma-54-dependent Fis family transcriptional regulator [Proteobacteria bacterium]|nr:sigma-54-dependent Fis family transcriptional regulator [Pseudomonadota bacterium]
MGKAKVSEAVLLGPQVFRVGHTEIRFTPIDEEIDVYASDDTKFEGLVGQSVAMRELFTILQRIARTTLNVLVIGETGTGKELVCRALHSRSKRHRGPLIIMDCGSAPPDLIESELFGHKKGSFTGATDDRQGLFEQADGGTLFIDELGELPLGLQPKLLRVLERREVRRVGDSKMRSVDVRVVAATNRDLPFEVAAGRFRSDLYYRLAVAELGLPPLRDRMEDLPLLVDHMLVTSPDAHAIRSVSDEVLEVLGRWHWPGNIRELRNVILRAIPFSNGAEVTLDALPEALRTGMAPRTDTPSLDMPTATTFREAKNELMDDFERTYLVDLMKRADGKLARAARIAGMDRRTVQRMLRTHDLNDLIKGRG